MTDRTRYRFSHREGDRYYWESVLPIGPNESRHEAIICRVGMFWRERLSPDLKRAGAR